MRKITQIFSIILLSWFSLALGQTPKFVEGKQYHIVSNAKTISSAPMDEQVQVIEFFNYGCPACNIIEPELEKWLTNKPADVAFSRVPVVFEDGWEIYAKAYYLAKELHLENKLSPDLFNTIHKKGVNLTDPVLLEAFFINHGVQAADVRSALDSSTAIDLDLKQGQSLAEAYQIMLIPSFIVAGKYKVSGADVKSDSELFEVLDFLIKKAKKH